MPDDAEPTDSATTPASSSTLETSTTPTTSADDYSVPAVIDAKYVDRVLAALNHVDGDALRLAIKENNLTKEVTDRILAINTEGWANVPLSQYSSLQLNAWNGLPPDASDIVMTVKEVAVATPDCVISLVSEGTRREPNRPVVEEYVVLVKADPARDPQQHNQTPWAFNFRFGVESLDSVPKESRCGG